MTQTYTRFVATENPLLRDELLLRDWVVKTVTNDPTSILDACGSVEPDAVYASAASGFRIVLETLAWAREMWGDLHCAVESRWSAEEDRQHLHHLPDVVMQGYEFTDGVNTSTLWVADDALYTRLLRVRDHAQHRSDIVSFHCITQLIAQFIDSERELQVCRAWPAELTVDPGTEDDVEGTESVQSERGSTRDDSKNVKEKVKPSCKTACKQAKSTGDECDATMNCSDGNDAVLLPYFFVNDPHFQSLSDEMEKIWYRAFKSKLWLRVDFWSDEVSQAWLDHCASGELFDMGALVERANSIRDKSLYSLRNVDWTPTIGMRVRKQFGGEYFTGSVIRVDDLREHDDDEEGKQRKTWIVQYDDEEGDIEEFEYHDLVKFRQGRNRTPSPLIGRPFRMLELFAGRSVVTGKYVPFCVRLRLMISNAG